MRQNNNFKDKKDENDSEPYGYICALNSNFGCTDSKVMNQQNAIEMKVEAIGGPTQGADLGIKA